MMTLLDNTLNQLFIFQAKNRVDINDDSRWTYNINSQIRLRLQFYNRVYDYTDAYIPVEGTMTVVRAWRDATAIQAYRIN